MKGIPVEEQTEEIKKLPNPARKWLIVSIAGLIVMVASLGVYYTHGGSNPSAPLPTSVIKHVFGFTPYYFVNNSPPAHLSLDTASTTFVANTLTYSLVTPRKLIVTISEQILPAKFTRSEFKNSLSVENDSGTGSAGTQDGHSKGEFITKDKTLIQVSASDQLPLDTINAILSAMAKVTTDSVQ